MARGLPFLRTTFLTRLAYSISEAIPTSSHRPAVGSHIPLGSPSFLKPFSSRSLAVFPRRLDLAVLPFFPHRCFASSSADSSNFVVIASDEELNSSLNKAQDGGSPAIFYFTAAWCGPCRYISPVIEELSKTYPHVTTYKIDIDMDGLGATLNKLNITAVPTIHFFHDGKKTNEVIGADVNQLRQIMEQLYK